MRQLEAATEVDTYLLFSIEMTKKLVKERLPLLDIYVTK